MLTKRAMNSKAVIDLLLFSVNFFFSLFFKNRRSRWLMLLTSPFVLKSATKAFAKAFWQYFLNSNELSNELSKISFLSRIIVLASVRQFLMEREKKKKRNLDQDQGLFGRKKNRRCYLSEDTCMHFCNVPDARFQVMPYGGASVIGDLDDFSGSRIAGSCAQGGRICTRWLASSLNSSSTRPAFLSTVFEPLVLSRLSPILSPRSFAFE